MFRHALHGFCLGVLLWVVGCGPRVRDYNENVPPPSVPPSGGGGLEDEGTVDGMPAEGSSDAVSDTSSPAASSSKAKPKKRQPDAPPVQTREAIFD